MPRTGFRERLALSLNNHFFYGWVMLGVAALVLLASGPGQSHTISVFVSVLVEDMGISATAVSFAYGFATLAAAFLLPFVGRQVDRHGMRKTALVITVLFTLACFAFSRVTGTVISIFGIFEIAIWLTLGFGMLRFLGQGALLLNAVNLISQWFSAKRGFAMGLMMLGFAGSMAIHPPLAQWLIDNGDWRSAYIWLGVITAVLLLPGLLVLVFNKPEDLGLLPDGAKADAQAGDAPKAAEFGLTISEAVRTPTFYLVAIGLFCFAMLVTMLHLFQISIFEAQGLTRELAARIFPVSAVAMVICMPLLGRMLDRFRTEWVFAGGLLVMAAALIAAGNVTDLTSGLIYGVIFGINNAVSMTFFGFMWPRYFGRRYIGSIQGTGQMIGVVGASLGPLPLGIAYDLTGDYTVTLMAFAAMPLIAMVLMLLFLRDPKQLQPSAD
ncbi:MAG: MFS transporter [Minwuia sp.]|nr:MFS transporter [Minwuia sp.]